MNQDLRIAWGSIKGSTTALIGTVCVSLVLINKLFDPKYLAYTMLAAAVANVVAVHLGIDTTPIEYRGTNSLRATGFLGNANVLAINLSLAAIVVWLMPQIPTFIRLLAVFTSLYGIAVSGSRKGLIFGVLLLLLVVFRLVRKLSMAAQSVLICTLFAAVGFLYQYLDEIVVFMRGNVLAINRFYLIFTPGPLLWFLLQQGPGHA